MVPDAAAAELERGPQPYHLSPDGTAVALMFMTDPEPKVRLVELDTGATLDFPAPTIAVQPTLSWAPDSSGLFDVVDGAVVFRDRTTGQVTELTALTELLAPGGGAKQVAVRSATPLDTGEGGTFAIDLIDFESSERTAVLDVGVYVLLRDGHRYTCRVRSGDWVSR